MKPVGSEKITNIDERLARIRQIAGIITETRTPETIAESNDNDSTILYESVASNGNEYAIVQEEKYVYIKKKVNESYEYMTGIRNLHEFSYKTSADALKHLNLMLKEINELNDHKENVELVKKKV